MATPTLVVFTKPWKWVNFRAQKILTVAALAGVSLHQEEITLDVENATHEFMHSCHPLGRIPVLKTAEGVIFESNAILRHVARMATNGALLLGRTPFEQATVDGWLDFAITEVDPIAVVYSRRFRFGSDVPPGHIDSVKELLGALDLRLGQSKTTFFLGDAHVSCADVAIAFGLQRIYLMNDAHAQELATLYPHVYRHYLSVMQLPQSTAVLKQFGSAYGVPKRTP